MMYARSVRVFARDSAARLVTLAQHFRAGRVTQATERRVSFNMPMSWWSFGEHVSVDVLDYGSDTAVDVTSRSRVATTLYDWGANARNVRAFWLFLSENGLTSLADLPICPLCEHPNPADADACTECAGPLGDAGEIYETDRSHSLWVRFGLLAATGIVIFTLLSVVIHRQLRVSSSICLGVAVAGTLAMTAALHRRTRKSA